jgi:hypothetical protein
MMKKILFLCLSISCLNVIQAKTNDDQLFCKGNSCSEFDKYIYQIKETYMKMKSENESCTKKDGKSCYEVGVLIGDSEKTIRPEFKDELARFHTKLGIAGDSNSYFKKACDLKFAKGCEELKK